VYTSSMVAPPPPMLRCSSLNLLGQFPGPVIEARSGDEIVVDVYNSLADDEGTAIHWHGLSMRGAVYLFLLSRLLVHDS